MAKCPLCGKEVKNPVREWDMGKLHIMMYEHYGKKFHDYVKRK